MKRQAEAVLTAWQLPSPQLSLLGTGLINETWLVAAAGSSYVLQRVNRIFPPEIHLDIEVVTRFLAARGLVTPLLVPTATGALWERSGDDIWRLMTYVDGVSHDRLTSTEQAREAATLLARFHRALGDLEHRFHSSRAGVHDTVRHLAALRAAVATHGDHRDAELIRPIAADILALAERLPELPNVTPRIVHGDPKLNNVLFSRNGSSALCLVDLDTLARMALPLELGDAFRSWCNPAGEDAAKASFSTELFTAAVQAYAEGVAGWITVREAAAVVPATLTIYVELAARFCADAYNESYFGWDPTRFASRSEHNRLRAQSQLACARSLAGQFEEAQAIALAAFSD